MGVSLWGESPLYENLEVFIVMDTNKSTSRRQGCLCEEGSEGSLSANVRVDEQKPHRRLSSWASWHNTTKPIRSWGKVNAVVVHGKVTFLSGEICLPCGRIFMRGIRELLCLRVCMKFFFNAFCQKNLHQRLIGHVSFIRQQL